MGRRELDLCGLEYGKIAGSCECGNEPPSCIKCREFLASCGTVSFSRRTLLHGVSLLVG